MRFFEADAEFAFRAGRAPGSRRRSGDQLHLVGAFLQSARVPSTLRDVSNVLAEEVNSSRRVIDQDIGVAGWPDRPSTGVAWTWTPRAGRSRPSASRRRSRAGRRSTFGALLASRPTGPCMAALAAALSFAGVTAAFFSWFVPTLSLPSWEAAKAVPPPSRRKRQTVEMTLREIGRAAAKSAACIPFKREIMEGVHGTGMPQVALRHFAQRYLMVSSFVRSRRCGGR